MKKNTTSDVWSEGNRERAEKEGWLLAPVVDEGKPVSSFYFGVFPTPDGKLASPTKAIAFVVGKARTGSAFHADALAVIKMSKLNAAQRGKR